MVSEQHAWVLITHIPSPSFTKLRLAFLGMYLGDGGDGSVKEEDHHDAGGQSLRPTWNPIWT